MFEQQFGKFVPKPPEKIETRKMQLLVLDQEELDLVIEQKQKNN